MMQDFTYISLEVEKSGLPSKDESAHEKVDAYFDALYEQYERKGIDLDIRHSSDDTLLHVIFPTGLPFDYAYMEIKAFLAHVHGMLLRHDIYGYRVETHSTQDWDDPYAYRN